MENISLLFKILVEIWSFEEHFLLGSPSESVPRQELYPLEDETGPEVSGKTAPKGGYAFGFGGAVCGTWHKTCRGPGLSCL